MFDTSIFIADVMLRSTRAVLPLVQREREREREGGGGGGIDSERMKQ